MASVLRDRDAVTRAVQTSSSMKECLITLGLRAAGSNYKLLRAACLEFDLSVPAATGQLKTAVARQCVRPLEDILVPNSTYSSRAGLKKKLLHSGLLQELCTGCGRGPEWNGKPLVLQLEHKNGIYDDNRLENLCLLCPNCHSQTPTFAGRNSTRVVKVRARPTRTRPRITKINWPDTTSLLESLKTMTCVALAKSLGVTDSAVRKRIRMHPPVTV